MPPKGKAGGKGGGGGGSKGKGADGDSESSGGGKQAKGGTAVKVLFVHKLSYMLSCSDDYCSICFQDFCLLLYYRVYASLLKIIHHKRRWIVLNLISTAALN